MQNMNGMKHLGSAVRHLREKKKLRLEDVANSMTKYDAGNLSRFERMLQDIESDKLQEVCTILEVTLSELAQLAETLKAYDLRTTDESNFTARENQSPGYNAQVEKGIGESLPNVQTDSPKEQFTKVNKVPVFQGEHVTALAEQRLDKVPPPVQTITSARDDTQPNDFAWLVNDDTMTAAPGAEISYPQGAFALFDPDIAHVSGDCVLVNLGGLNNAFTQVVNAGGRWMMVPLNSRYPARDLPGDTKVVAVAIGVQMSTRRRK